MIKKKAICFIPARGGSKRIPKKNKLALNGKPLISYTINAAIESNTFDEIIVSTDDESIVKIAKSYNVSIHKRSEYLSGDKITKVQVINTYLQENKLNYNKDDIITCLLPTCPFRNKNHIIEAFELFTKNIKTPYLISVTEYDFPIQLALKEVAKDIMSPHFENGFEITRSQDLQTRYHPNGAIYMATIESFLKIGSFFNNEVLTYKMNALESFDIDYPYQFKIAQFLSKEYFKNEKK